MTTESSHSTYPVKLRGISADLSKVGKEFEEHDLGSLNAEALVALLEKFTAIEAVQLVDHEPEILLSGPRGRFTAKNHQSKLTLLPTGATNSAFLEIPAQAIPEWLDQAEGTPLTAGTATTVKKEAEITASRSSRTGLVGVLLVLSLIAAGVSAYVTLQPTAIDNPKDYTTITDLGQLAGIDQHARGRFVNEDGSIELLIGDNRSIVLSELDGSDSREETPDHYTPMLDAKGDSVLFTTDIGVVTLTGKDSLRYNGSPYTRAK